MPVPYVAAIRSVLDTYPPSKGLFREILQNSKDAKATKQIFVLDHRTPAHDSVFSDSDFKSLFNLWDSSKKADTSQESLEWDFDRRFIDTPQVLSASTLAILDPLNNNDVQINLDTAEKRASIIDPFALRLFQPTDPTVFQGTVDEIRISLLFLTNVSSIEIFKLGTNTSRKIINHPFAEHDPKRHLRPFMHRIICRSQSDNRSEPRGSPALAYPTHVLPAQHRLVRALQPPRFRRHTAQTSIQHYQRTQAIPPRTHNRPALHIPPPPPPHAVQRPHPRPLRSHSLARTAKKRPHVAPPTSTSFPFHSPSPSPHQPPHPQHLHRMEQTPVRRVPPQDMDVPPVHAHKHTLRTPDPKRLRRLAAPAGCRPARRQRVLGKVFSNTSSIISSSPNAASGRSLDPPAGFASWETSLLRETGRGMGCIQFLTPTAAHTSLLGLTDKLASDALQDKLPVILKYLLSTRNLDTSHVLLDRSVYDLFKACDGDDSAIALAHIDPQLADLLLLNDSSRAPQRRSTATRRTCHPLLGYPDSGSGCAMRDWHPVSAAKSTLPSARSPSPLRALYEAHSSFLPHPTLTSTNLITSLHILNLMQTTLSTDILRDRIRHITTTQDHACARALVSVIYETGFKLPRIGEVYERWMPGSSRVSG
ncbi:hypothetical protein H2248_001825 [Termitomyces sp. 'cryptogamus']|nr:hypothetical protein H2248_001825 [Termitomyces sp. 'cryptogamus']